MDFLGVMPKSKGVDSILVVVDRLSKSSHFIPFNHPYTEGEVASIFIKEVVQLHGFPSSTVLDRDCILIIVVNCAL